MIVSLLYRVLYPLSRYLWTGKPAEALKLGQRDRPVAVLDGKEQCDGSAVTNKTFTESQETLSTDGETEERMKEPNHEREDKPDGRAEHEETENNSQTSEEEFTVMEEEAETRNEQRQQDELSEPEMTDQCDMIQTKENTEDVCVIPESSTQIDHMQTDKNSPESPLQERIHSPTLEEPQTEVTECWDEYVSVMAGEMHSGDCSPLFNVVKDTQSSWHFPTGPGLSEEVQCPLWEFPAATYYPPTEPALHFDVMWRVWENVDAVEGSDPLPFTKPSMNITVMSYNILAEDLIEANQQLYTHCPLEVLDWSYRLRLLLEEIHRWQPDILCLQEVQENHYHEHLYPELVQMGYSCVYKRRTGNKTDGCATCYRSDRFLETSVTAVEFFRPDSELLDRHNVALVLLLRPVVSQGSEVRARGGPLCVANTHLLFSPRRGDVKLAQLGLLLAHLDRLVTACRADGETCNVLMCGDFNSVPHTPLYQLITTGELHYHGLPAWRESTTAVSSLQTQRRGTVTTSLQESVVTAMSSCCSFGSVQLRVSVLKTWRRSPESRTTLQMPQRKTSMIDGSDTV